MTKKMKVLGLLALAIGITGCFVSKKQTTERKELTKSQKEICSIADKDAEYALKSMERLKGKAILLPEVIALNGILRYAEATNNNSLINRVVALYKAAYLEKSSLNKLSYGHIVNQATAIIPLKLYRLTGDKSLLKDCWKIVQGMLRNPQKNGAFKNARWDTDDMFIISMLQLEANKVYGNQAGVDFVSTNLSLYMDKLNTEKPFFERWREWDKDGNWVGISIRELIWILPTDHEMREDFNKQYLATQGMCDPEESLAVFSIVELLKQTDNAKLLDEYNKIMNEQYERLNRGVMESKRMFPFVNLYAMATGVRYGWLKDEKYKKLISAKWADFSKNYKAPELQSYNVIYKPLLRQSGRLLFATAMLELDKKVNNNTKNTAQIAEIKRTFSDLEIAKTLQTYKALRNAEVKDDVKTIEKIQASFKFNNILDVLVGIELYRLTGNYDNEVRFIEVLNNLIETPLKNKDLNSLLLAQGFKVYGTQKFAQAAKINLNNSKLLKNICKGERLFAHTDPSTGERPFAHTRAEDIYKLGMSSNDAASATANSAKLRELCNKLQAKTGFFKHCESSKGLSYSRVSGQAIYGITNLLKNLPKDNENYTFFVRKIKDMAYALERNQNARGLWHTLPEDFNSPQDSLGSAFFVATFATALEEKWIHRLDFRDIVDLGWKGVQSKVKNGKLTSIAPACEPRKISSGYALLKQVTGDALSQEALKVATSATKSYYASNVPNSEENQMGILGPMSEINAYLYKGALPDGRILKHISSRASFDITFPIDVRKYKKDKLIASNPKLYPEDYFSNTNYEVLSQEKINNLPETIKKLKYPVAGITVWLEDNPSIHTMSDELGYCVLSMPYVPVSKDSKTANDTNVFKVMAQIPGFKPVVADKNRS